ncbi:hypothetical protein NHX12_022063 [Muraenolepis orangiensis]|uniref:Uncharacterized protein n=1 Tax=Muraenolepis orangiensis TaxID=630683 RepID=A0A9Q0IT33_9TELE|nr:hypothetical protein NHX12_022063 [Muraenolepis orangiensis]
MDKAVMDQQNGPSRSVHAGSGSRGDHGAMNGSSEEPHHHHHHPRVETRGEPHHPRVETCGEPHHPRVETRGEPHHPRVETRVETRGEPHHPRGSETREEPPHHHHHPRADGGPASPAKRCKLRRSRPRTY